jgi:peptidoglycan-associated lipoprotein
VFLLAAVTLVGCAKRPAVIMAGAPPSTGLSSAVQGGTTGAAVSESSAVVVTEQAPAATTTVTESAAAAAQPMTTAPAAPVTAGAESAGTDRQIAAAPAPQEAPAASPSSTVAQATPRPEQRDFQPMTELEAIYFDFDKSDIRPDAVRVLQSNANWFRSNPNYLILIEGHCDERGTNDYNLALGERRARSTMNYLIAQGVESRRMTVVSYGEERPVCTEKNEACWQKNRRAAFLVKETVPSALPAAATGAAPAATGSSPAPSATTGPTEKVTEPVSSPSQPGAPTPPKSQQRQVP